MITPEHARLMARYDRRQNRSVVQAADGLDDEGRRHDRGAFFGSVARTLNHVHRDDRIWLARLAGRPEDQPHAHPYADLPRDWAAPVRDRAALDDDIVAWADGVDQAGLDAVVPWRRGDEDLTPTRAFCAVHMFDHHTHHRGQVHAMLTAAGASPEPTDLPVLPNWG